MTMTIRDWPLEERPREKLYTRGAAVLSDAELLALFIGSGRRGMTAVDLGRELLLSAGNLKSLLDQMPAELAQRRGLGMARACTLHAALELGRRYLACELQRETLANPTACANFLRTRIGAYPYEVFACLFLDQRHRVLAFEELFRGSIDGASVHPREIVRQALHYNAAALIFAHNHPSGVAEASQADELITRRLRDALALVDIRVLDHLIVGDNNCLSFAERGLL